MNALPRRACLSVLLWLVSAAGPTAPAWGAAPEAGPAGHRFENQHVRVRLIPRSPDQVAAFYIGRGFPAPMVELIRGQCFITVGVRNRSRQIVWHDLSRWSFRNQQGQAIERRTRPWWRDQWRAMNAPKPSQATFRWTLMPEQLDFRPGEAEGGNVVLPATDGDITLDAEFMLGDQGDGESLAVRFEGLRCAQGAPS